VEIVEGAEQPEQTRLIINRPDDARQSSRPRLHSEAIQRLREFGAHPSPDEHFENLGHDGASLKTQVS
jgi:hypothetical protein